MDRWKSYLFEQHSEETLKAWARKLSVFRFVRARGGHVGDGDRLEVVFRYGSTDQLLSFFRRVGVEPVIHPGEPPQPVPGTPYPGDATMAFPSLIPGTAWIEQPRRCTILGIDVFMWCSNRLINISIGTDFDVTGENVDRAACLEPLLTALPYERVDPPEDSEHCICPRYYPEYFG